MKTLNDLIDCIKTFNKEYKRPGMDELQISEKYNLQEDFSKETYPNSDLPGIYLLLNQQSQILRIGKASCGKVSRSTLADAVNFRIIIMQNV